MKLIPFIMVTLGVLTVLGFRIDPIVPLITKYFKKHGFYYRAGAFLASTVYPEDKKSTKIFYLKIFWKMVTGKIKVRIV